MTMLSMSTEGGHIVV